MGFLRFHPSIFVNGVLMSFGGKVFEFGGIFLRRFQQIFIYLCGVYKYKRVWKESIESR